MDPGSNPLSEFLSRWEEIYKRDKLDVPARELWPDASPEEMAELERRLEGLRLMWIVLNPVQGQVIQVDTFKVPDGYQVLKWLGRGGFGEVLAVRARNGDDVALKYVDLSKHGAEMEVAAQEVMSGRHHECLVKTLKTWKVGQYLVIEMELGLQSLMDWFHELTARGEPGISPDKLIPYLSDAARGIDFLNESRHAVADGRGRWIAHGDIKPQNLLLFQTGAKVADFGLVRVSHDKLTGHHGAMTLAYAAPEVIEGNTSKWSDQYSLAVTYCVLLTGRFPFMEINRQGFNGGLESRTLSLTLLPAEEQVIVARALAKQPEDRWPNCQEFVAQLRGAGRPRPLIKGAASNHARIPLSAPDLHPRFTGRKEELELLRKAFQKQAVQGKPNVQVLSGLGGIGKTQLARQYVAEHHKEYQEIFWVHASSPASRVSGFTEIARLLGLPLAQDADQGIVVAAARRWLEDHRDWLLVLDNADEPHEIMEFLPRTGGGHVLLTSRDRLFDQLGVKPLTVPVLAPDDALRFLLVRTYRTNANPQEERAAAELARELGYLPLALEAVGAYVHQTQVSFQKFLVSYRKNRINFLEKMSPMLGDYPDSVATTWTMNFAKVKSISRASADLLQISALLHPDAIPLELLEKGGQHLGPAIATALKKWGELGPYELLKPLTRYSLVQLNIESQTYSMHFMVREVVRATMKRTRKIFSERVVRAMATIIPDTDFHQWRYWERLLPQALCGVALVDEWGLSIPEAGLLLYRVGNYLRKRGQLVKAGLLLMGALDIREKALGLDHPEVASILNNLAILLFDQGKYLEAQPVFKRALAISEKALGPDHPNVASVLNNLAILLFDQGKYLEAQPVFNLALAISEKALGPDHPNVATNRYNLAILLSDQGKYLEAQPLYERVLAISEKALGPDHPNVASNLNCLANLLRDQGKYPEAQPLHERALAIREKALGLDHPDVATSLDNLANLLRDQGKSLEAQPLYERALAIREKALEPDHPGVASSLNNLAILHLDQSKYLEAQPLVERALAIREKALGPDHTDVASSLNCLANLLRAQGKSLEVQPLYERALAISEKALGPDHPNVASNLNCLANLLRAQGKYLEAQPLYERALAISEKALGPDHPNVASSLNCLANLLRDQGKSFEVQPLYERALAIREKALGPNHPDVARSLNNLANLHLDQSKYLEAQPLVERALAIREKALGPDHPNVASNLYGLAILLHAQGKYLEAQPLYERLLAIREKALGPDHSNVASSLNNLANLLSEQGKYLEAQPLYERALAISEKALGPDHPDVATSLNCLANLLRDQGKYPEAQPLVERALAIHEKALGSDHPDVATSLNNLAILLSDQGKSLEVQPLVERALAIREKALGPDHPDVASSLDNLANLLSDQGKDIEAEPLYKRALAIREKALGPGHSTFRRSSGGDG